MKKLFIITVVVVVALATLVPLALPVVAADLNDTKPIAWVSWTGCNEKDVRDYKYSKSVKQINLKLMSDGSIEGGFDIISFEGGVNKVSFPVLALHFTEVDGAKTADILSSAGGVYFFWWRLVDGGEPALLNDKWMNYVWFDFTNYPSVVSGPDPLGPGMPAYAWPPVAVEWAIPGVLPTQWPLMWHPWPQNEPGIIGEPLRPSAPDNLQIHITDAYWALLND